MAKEQLEKLIKNRKDKLTEIKTGYNKLDNQYSISGKLIFATIKDYEFLISELEKVYKLLCST